MKSGYYISYMQSDYHPIFVDMGYPELDVLKYEDGEWWIIQYYNSPVVPCLTKWQTVLGPMRNLDISYGFLHRFATALDINNKKFWADEMAKSKEAEDEWEKTELHAEESASRAHIAITRNPWLMDRIARNGLKEMDLYSIAKHIPKSEI